MTFTTFFDLFWVVWFFSFFFFLTELLRCFIHSCLPSLPLESEVSNFYSASCTWILVLAPELLRPQRLFHKHIPFPFVFPHKYGQSHAIIHVDHLSCYSGAVWNTNGTICAMFEYTFTAENCKLAWQGAPAVPCPMANFQWPIRIWGALCNPLAMCKRIKPIFLSQQIQCFSVKMMDYIVWVPLNQSKKGQAEKVNIPELLLFKPP